MRAVWLMVLCGVCLNVVAHSNAVAVESCSSVVSDGAGDTINARRPVTSGLNLSCNDTTVGAKPKHVFQEKTSDIPYENLPATRVQEFNQPPRHSAPVNWITQVVSTLTPLPNDLGTSCRRDTETYLHELSNFTDWAVRMMDASAKLPHGVLMGNIRSMGDFDECLWTEPAEEIEPQYCLASIYNMDIKDTHPMYEKLQHVIQIMTYGRMNGEMYETTVGSLPMQRSGRVEWAMCIPASCSPMDVEIMLSTAGKRILHESDIKVRVHSKDCYKNSQSSEFSIRDQLILSSMLIILSLVIVGTLQDQPDSNNNLENEEKQLGTKIMEAFSIKRSWKKLTDFSPSQSSRQIRCLDGLRGISSLWVVMGHQALLASSNPYSDKVTFFNTQQYAVLMILWNFFLPVDTFLVIGGLVRSYNLIPGLERNTVNHWKSAVTRYLRLTPALLVVIGFYISVMYRLSTGPFWNRQVGENKLACEWNWWKAVLYINNYIYNEEEGYHIMAPDEKGVSPMLVTWNSQFYDQHLRQIRVSHWGLDDKVSPLEMALFRECLLQSWYTSVDMQLYLLAPLVIVPMCRYPKFGFSLLIGLAGIATAGEYATIVLHKLPALPITIHSDDMAILTYLRTFYFVSHTRAMPYLIGIAIGYIMHHYKTVTMTKPQLILGWSLSFVGLFWPLFGSAAYLPVEYPLGSWRHAYFGAFHKSVWAVAISWMIFACHHGYGGYLNSFLSCRLLKFMARISYSVFLLHLGILICFSGYLRGPKHTDIPSVAKEMIGELSFVIGLSTLLHLIVEAPFAELAQLVFKKTRIEAKKTTDLAKS